MKTHKWEVVFFYSNGQIYREMISGKEVTLALETAKVVAKEIHQQVPTVEVFAVDIRRKT